MSPERRDLLEAWAAATRITPALVEDNRWTDSLADITSGRPLAHWVSAGESDPSVLPIAVPGRFLGSLEAVVEDEAGVDLDHLDEVYLDSM